MKSSFIRTALLLLAAATLLVGAASAGGGGGGDRAAQPDHAPPRAASARAGPATPAGRFEQLNRLTWGANAALLDQTRAADAAIDAHFLARQLDPGPARLPAAAQAQIDALTISREPVEPLVRRMIAGRRAANELASDDDKQAARKAWQQAMNRLEREAATRHVLRALYSPNQLQEQMTWFWLNHFSVYARKGELRALVGDYEESALRPHALGRFRDLLGAVAQHPAMLRYLDNAQNAANKVNENYARELMELHTLGQRGGYSQQDVQELARVLTGVGIARDDAAPWLAAGLRPFYVRRGLFEFNPRRHDFGAKQFLGAPIRARGLAEFDEALDRLARHPATARFISRKLAVYWLADEPPAALVERMAQTFERSDGDIARVLQTLLTSPEFGRGAGSDGKFKDPMRYAMSALRLVLGDSGTVIGNAEPVLNWLNRMGEPLYGRPTPDGYPLEGGQWTSAGQLATRFEIAKAIGSGRAPLFAGADAVAAPLEGIDPALVRDAVLPALGPATRAALKQAASPQEWTTFLLASPEFMRR